LISYETDVVLVSSTKQFAAKNERARLVEDTGTAGFNQGFITMPEFVYESGFYK
jgi:hypothetical protein